MFSSPCFARKSPFIKKTFPLFFTVCLVMGSALFSSCDWGNGGDTGGGGSITGDWTAPSAGDTYEIRTTTVRYNSGYAAMDFTGAIVSTEQFNNSSGVIIFRYTAGAPTTGRTYGAVYYRGLTAAQMEIALAGLWESEPPYQDITPKITSETQAKAEFTRDKGDGYYVKQWGGPYVKQQP
jgi:hypothetical protein